MTVLFAQPYNIDAAGFFFNNLEEYQAKVKHCVDAYGSPVEEFEIQFNDGDEIDWELFEAWGVHQSNLPAFLTAVEEWDERQKQRFIIAVGACGYPFNPDTDSPDDFDIDLYAMESLNELAHYFVEEGLFGDIPQRLQYYIDYDAIARDLAVDYSEITIEGKRFIYRCG